MWDKEERVLRNYYMYKKTNKKQNKLLFTKLTNIDAKVKEEIIKKFLIKKDLEKKVSFMERIRVSNSDLLMGGVSGVKESASLPSRTLEDYAKDLKEIEGFLWDATKKEKVTLVEEPKGGSPDKSMMVTDENFTQQI
jgi:hypothetical protein